MSEKTGNADQAPDPIATLTESVNQLAQSMGQLVQTQGEIVKGMSEISGRVEAVEQIAYADDDEPDASETPEPTLADGMVRFFSPMRELAILYVDEDQTVINGQTVMVPTAYRGPRTRHEQPKTFQFIGGVLDVDEAAAAYLRTLPGFGQEFWEDSGAHRQISGVQVKTGPRGPEPEQAIEPSLSAILP